MLEILDSLIATIGVVLVLSLIVQAIQQIIKQVWSFKSGYMERELLAMFDQSDEGSEQDNKSAVDQSNKESKQDSKSTVGQSDNGSKKDTNLVGKRQRRVLDAVLPSLLGAKQWLSSIWLTKLPFLKRGAQWLYNIVTPTALKSRIERRQNKDVAKLVDEIKKKVAGLGYNDLSLLENVKKADFIKIVESLPAKQRLEKWKEDVETWYDLTLKAFQDHYERRMKAWSYVLSFLVVIWLNANIFQIHKEFSSNKTLRDSAVKMAEHMAAVPRDRLIESPTKRDSLLLDSLAMKAIQRNIAYIDSLVDQKSFHFMRWNTANGDPMGIDTLWTVAIPISTSDFAKATRKNLFGWLAMTLLVGLGAPFWYDVLKTVMGLKDRVKATLPTGSRKPVG